MSKSCLILVLALFIFSASLISAVCTEGQIDINSASEAELQEITQIGPARAEQMITLRPFSSVDDMIRIVGIGENNINLIKSQGLACVADEDDEVNKEEEAINNETIKISDTADEDASVKNSAPREIELELIELNTKAIKSENGTEEVKETNYAIYGLIGFSILIIALFLLKSIKRRKEKLV